MPTMPTPALPVVLLLLAASKAASQGICFDPIPSSSPAPAPLTSNNTNNSSALFRANVLTLLNALPQATAPTGFASLSLGTGRDRAFVRGLCRGDTTPSQCLADMQASVFDLRGKCASNRSAAAYYDKAYITFADTNATVNYYYERHSLEVLYDTLRVSDPESFDRTYNVLMKSLVARAASQGGNTSAMFATGEAVYAPSDPKGTIYGLVQCMRDLSASQCDWCLQTLVPVLPTCCNGYQGGVARNFNCLLRIQIYTFYDLALDAPPPAAPTPGSPDETRRRTRLLHVILVVAISVGTLFVLVVVLACVRRQRRRIKAKKEQQDNAGEGLNYISLQVLKAATSNFSINNKLGEGGFGEVFKIRRRHANSIGLREA